VSDSAIVTPASGVSVLDETQRKERIPELDGLRGIAILLVLVWHYLPGILADAPPVLLHLTNTFIRFAWSGVDLFFVLSGFLLGGILLDNRESRHYFKTFYARRFYRIAPVYYVMVGVYILLQHANRPDRLAWLFDQPMPLWSYLTFTQNFAMAQAGYFGAQWLGVTWSLAVEEQFYLVLPFIVRFIPSRRLGLALVLLAVGAPVTRLALFFTHAQWGTAGYVLMPARADALMLGVLAAVAIRRADIRALAVRKRSALYRVFGLLSLAGVTMALMHETVGSTNMVLYGYSVIALFHTAVLVLAVTAGKGELLGRVLRWAWLRKIGTVAYGVYLVHLPVVGLASLLVSAPAPVYVLAFGLTFILAWLSWEYFEKPLVRRGHRYQY